jgi:hypothetical protein
VNSFSDLQKNIDREEATQHPDPNKDLRGEIGSPKPSTVPVVCNGPLRALLVLETTLLMLVLVLVCVLLVLVLLLLLLLVLLPVLLKLFDVVMLLLLV